MTAVNGQHRKVEHERRGVLNATTIFLLGLRHDPGGVRIMLGAGSFQRLRRRGMPWGLWQERIRKAPAVPRSSSGCVVAKKPPAL